MTCMSQRDYVTLHLFWVSIMAQYEINLKLKVKISRTQTLGIDLKHLQ